MKSKGINKIVKRNLSVVLIIFWFNSFVANTQMNNQFHNERYVDFKKIDKSTENVQLTIFTNPENGIISAKFSYEKEVNYKIIVYNLLGSKMQIHKGTGIKGKNIIPLNTSNFTSGIYVLKLILNDKETYSRRFIKQ